MEEWKNGKKETEAKERSGKGRSERKAWRKQRKEGEGENRSAGGSWKKGDRGRKQRQGMNNERKERAEQRNGEGKRGEETYTQWQVTASKKKLWVCFSQSICRCDVNKTRKKDISWVILSTLCLSLAWKDQFSRLNFKAKRRKREREKNTLLYLVFLKALAAVRLQGTQTMYSYPPQWKSSGGGSGGGWRDGGEVFVLCGGVVW